MKNTNKRFLAILLAVLMVLGLAACGTNSGVVTSSPSGTSAAGSANASAAATASASANASADPSKMKLKDQINIALTAENGVYDLYKSTSVSARTLFCGTVFEQLVTLNGKSEPVPELCKSFDVNADATEFVFHLRDGVKFHDGSVMTASDVVASLNHWIECYSAVAGLVGDARFQETDKSTVKITTKTPCINLLYLLAGGAQRAVITTAAATKNLDAKGNMKDLIGTGPYKVSKWVLDQYLMLTRFDDYVPYGDPNKPSDGWAGYKHAYTKNICLWVVPEESTRSAGLQTGQYDSANLSAATVPTVKSNSALKLYTEAGGQVAIVFNKKEGLCADANMRKAVNSIVDADELLVVSYGDAYNLGSCYMEKNQPLWYTDAGSKNYNTKDTAAAANFLKAAGYAGKPLRILVSNANNFDKIGQVLKMELEKNGIKCEMTTVDWATFTQYRTDSAKYDLYISSFAAVPVPSLKSYFGASYAGWTNDAKLTSMLKDYSASKTLDAAAKAWVGIQEYCWDYLPLINLGHYISQDAMNAKMKDVIYRDGAYYWNAYIPAN